MTSISPLSILGRDHWI